MASMSDVNNYHHGIIGSSIPPSRVRTSLSKSATRVALDKALGCSNGVSSLPLQTRLDHLRGLSGQRETVAFSNWSNYSSGYDPQRQNSHLRASETCSQHGKSSLSNALAPMCRSSPVNGDNSMSGRSDVSGSSSKLAKAIAQGMPFEEACKAMGRLPPSFGSAAQIGIAHFQSISTMAAPRQSSLDGMDGVPVNGHYHTSSWMPKEFSVQHEPHAQPNLLPTFPFMNFQESTKSPELMSAIARHMKDEWDLSRQYSFDYLLRFINELSIGTGSPLLVVLTAMVYIERLRKKFPNSGAQSCAKRIFAMGMLTASKFHLDQPYNNSVWARMAKINVAIFAQMEVQFVVSLDFRLNVEWEELVTVVQSLATASMPLTETLKELEEMRPIGRAVGVGEA